MGPPPSAQSRQKPSSPAHASHRSIKSNARVPRSTTIMMSSDVNPKNPPSNVAPFSSPSPKPTGTASSPSAPAPSASSPSPASPSSSHQWSSVPVTDGSSPPMR